MKTINTPYSTSQIRRMTDQTGYAVSKRDRYASNDSDCLLEETDAFLSLDDSIPPGIDDDTYNLEGDILFLERLLDDDPSPDLPPTPYPVCLINDAEKIKPSIEDPPDLILKDLPS
ncbi:hypothetical protein Tco_0211010 [Tanacetum coccineum]